VIQNDGDIVRGLGFVTLYAAYLEEEIDNLLTMLNSIEIFDEEKQRRPASRKIREAVKIVGKLNGQGLSALIRDLGTCIDLLEDRNELIHGRIYGNFDRPDTLKSGRPNVPDREVLPEELYNLANKFANISSAIFRPMLFDIPSALESRDSGS